MIIRGSSMPWNFSKGGERKARQPCVMRGHGKQGRWHVQITAMLEVGYDVQLEGGKRGKRMQGDAARTGPGAASARAHLPSMIKRATAPPTQGLLLLSPPFSTITHLSGINIRRRFQLVPSRKCHRAYSTSHLLQSKVLTC